MLGSYPTAETTFRYSTKKMVRLIGDVLVRHSANRNEAHKQGKCENVQFLLILQASVLLQEEQETMNYC
jgi:hypothetical protein